MLPPKQNPLCKFVFFLQRTFHALFSTSSINNLKHVLFCKRWKMVNLKINIGLFLCEGCPFGQLWGTLTLDWISMVSNSAHWSMINASLDKVRSKTNRTYWFCNNWWSRVFNYNYNTVCVGKLIEWDKTVFMVKKTTQLELYLKNDLVLESRTDLAGFEVSGVLGYWTGGVVWFAWLIWSSTFSQISLRDYVIVMEVFPVWILSLH